MPDNWQALREALKAMPTDGRWDVCGTFDNDGSQEIVIGRRTAIGTLSVAVALPGLARQEANAALIAAANPATIRALLDERDQLARSLALVQQHHATAWNRGHTMGMAAQEETARKALEAVKQDAWGNAQLTEALMAAEAERDELRQEVERLRAELGQLTAYADALNERCIADAAEIGRLRECLEWLQERHQGGLMRAKIDEALGAAKAQGELG